MLYVNQKIMGILSKVFGISKTDIDTDTNIIVEYNLSGWELELLYAKIQEAFKIPIDLPISPNGLSVMKLIKMYIL